MFTVKETVFNVNIALKTVSKFGYFVYKVLIDKYKIVCYTIIKEKVRSSEREPLILERWLSYDKGIRILQMQHKRHQTGY